MWNDSELIRDRNNWIVPVFEYEDFIVISNIIALAIFPLFMVMSFVHRYGDGEFEKEFLSKRQTTVVKGIMIMMVFFHHFSQICTEATLIEYVYRLIQVGIAFFFFLAGYTEGVGHIIGKHSLKEKWINRLWRLYLPVMVFTLPINNFLTPLLLFFAWSDIAYHFWDSDKKRLIAIALGNVLYVVICRAIGMSEYWYDDVLTFFVGVAMAMYKDRIIEFFKSRLRSIVSLVSLLIVTYMTFAYMLMSSSHFDIAVTIYSFAACLILIIIMMKVNVKSKIFYFIGQYSYEIYILHQVFMVALNKVFRRNSVVMILAFALSLGIGIVLQSGVKALRAKITDKKKMA